MLDKIRLPIGCLLVRPILEEGEEPLKEEKITTPEFGKKNDPCDEDSWIGEIVLVGPPAKDEEDKFEVGEKALFSSYDGEAIMIGGIYHRVVGYDDPVLVFTD